MKMGKSQVVGAFLDITERKRVEEALRESEQKFRLFVEQSSDGLVLTDEQGIIIEWNQTQEYLTGFPSAGKHRNRYGRCTNPIYWLSAREYQSCVKN